MELKISPLPVKATVTVDYEAIADTVIKNGPMLVSADINNNAFHAMLHKYGIGVYAVKLQHGHIYAYSIERKRKRATIGNRGL